MQGDVFALTDMEGNVVIEYNYDPWGRITYNYLGEGNGAEDEEFLKLFTAIFCPLTYRGYNYDFTTGLYYLQSRYYNPDWGRFLNVDDTSILLATQGETHGANLFAYCENNPVNKVDYTGKNSFAFLEPLFEIFLPLAAADKRLHEVGLGFDVDRASNTQVRISINAKSGVVLYDISFDVYVDSYCKRFYSFVYYYGNTEQWDLYISNIEKNFMVGLATSLTVGLAAGVIGVFTSPLVGFLISAGVTVSSVKAGHKKSFATASRAVLNNTPNNSYYGCLDRVVDTTVGSYVKSVTKYKGDDSIHVIY